MCNVEVCLFESLLDVQWDFILTVSGYTLHMNFLSDGVRRNAFIRLLRNIRFSTCCKQCLKGYKNILSQPSICI